MGIRRALLNGKREKVRQGSEGNARKRIAEAVVEVVGTEGYRATTIEGILERARVSRKEFEALFGDKAGCYLEVYEEQGRQFMARTGEAFMAGGDWRERLRRTAYATYDYFRENPARARFITLEPLQAGDRTAAFLEANIEMLVELVHAGRFELEEPDSVPRSTAVAAVGSIWNRLLMIVRNDELEKADGDQTVRELMYVAVLPYLGEEAAREELAMARPTQAPGAMERRELPQT